MRKALLALAALAAWHLVLRAHGFEVPLVADEGEYAVVARTWAEGGLPYRDAFSQKPPLTFLLYRLPWSPRATACAFSLLTGGALFLTAPAAWPLAARLAAPAAYASLSTLPLGDYGFPANTEGFLNLFAALAVLALSRRRAFLAGLCLGAAVMTKQTAAYTGAAVLGLTFFLDGPRAAARALAGAAVLPALASAYFAARGAHAAYWECVFGGNARYVTALVMTGALGAQVRWFFSALLPSLLLYWAPALLLLVRGLRGVRADARGRVETAAALWFGASVAGALTGLFLFPHYFLQAAPGLALCAAAGVKSLRERRVAAAAALLLAVWPALLSPRLYFLAGPREAAVRLLHPNPVYETELLGKELARRARPGDRLYVFGYEGALFAHSGLTPATPRTVSYAVTLFPKGPADVESEYRLLAEGPAPRFFVWSAQPLATLVSNRASADFAARLREEYLRGYRYLGRVDVTGAPPVFVPAAVGHAPDFTPGDRLLLFERKEP